jgi:beta-carotene hydroxylase
MQAATRDEIEMPTLEDLGGDLVATTRYQRRVALARPFIGVAVYILVAYAELWWLTPLVVFLIFGTERAKGTHPERLKGTHLSR